MSFIFIKKAIKNLLLSIGAMAAPIFLFSSATSSRASDGVESNKIFLENGKIANTKIWSMEYDNKNSKLSKKYEGVIIPEGVQISKDDILKSLKIPQESNITWDNKKYMPKKGVYTALINQNREKFIFKIFVSGRKFDFNNEFQNKTLPDGFSLPQNINEIANNSFLNSKLNEDFIIPSSVIKIGNAAFFKAKLNQRFKISKGIREIGTWSFLGAKLNKNFVIPDSVTDISDYSFANIKKLPEGFKLPVNLNKISSMTFSGVTLNDDFMVPNKVSQIERYAFQKSNLNKKFRLPHSLNNFNKEIFKDSKFDSVDFGWNSVKSSQEANDRFDEILSIEEILDEFVNDKNKGDIFKNTQYDFVFQKDSLFKLIKNHYKKKLTLNHKFYNQFIESIEKNEKGLCIKFSRNIKNKKEVTIRKDSFQSKRHFISNSSLFGNMKVWKMEYNSNEKKLKNPYEGVIIPEGINMSENDILKSLKVPQGSMISWVNEKYKPQKGVYNAVINQSGKKFKFKIFVTDNKFDFASSFANKKLPYLFAIPNNVTEIGSLVFENSILNDNFKIPPGIKKIEKFAFTSASLNSDFKLSNNLKEYIKSIFMDAKYLSIDFDWNTIKSSAEANSRFLEISKIKSILDKFILDKNKYDIFKETKYKYPFTKDSLFTLISNKYFDSQSYKSSSIFFKQFIKNIQYKEDGLHIQFENIIKNGSDIIIKPSLFSNLTNFKSKSSLLNKFSIWNIEFDQNGQSINEPYEGVIVSKGTKITDKNIKDLLKDGTNAKISWNKPYKPEKGIYVANISDGSREFIFKIFVSHRIFDFNNEFQNKTLPKGFSIPQNIIKINDNSFLNSKLNEDFKLPYNIQEIGAFAFKRVKLNKEFILPKSVNKIKDHAFSHVDFNEKFRFPKSIKIFGGLIFDPATYLSIDFFENLSSAEAINKRFDELSFIKNKLEEFINDKSKDRIFNKLHYNQAFTNISLFQLILDNYKTSDLNLNNIKLVDKFIDNIYYKNDELHIKFKEMVKSGLEVVVKKESFIDYKVTKANADIEFVKKEILKFSSNGFLNSSKNIEPILNERFNEKALDDLAGFSLNFPNDIKGTKLSYSHAGIKEDGKIKVTVNIEKYPGTKQTVNFIVLISGINKAKDEAKKIAKYLINNINQNKKLIIGAIEPRLEQMGFKSAKKQSILDIENAQTIQSIQIAKKNGKNLVEAARDKLDNAIEQANNNFISKTISDLIDAKKQEINNIQPTKILILGATIPVSDQTNFKEVKEKAILNIENAQTIQSIQIAKKNGKNLVEDARDELDNAIEQANNDFIYKTKVEAKKQINNIQPTKVLIQGATKPVWIQTNFNKVKEQAILNIENAQTIQSIQIAKKDGKFLSEDARDELDNAIEQANNAFISKTKDKIKQEIIQFGPNEALIPGANKPEPTQTNFDNAKKQSILDIDRAKNINAIQKLKASIKTKIEAARDKLDKAIEQANNAFISKIKDEAKKQINNIQPTKVLIQGATKPKTTQTNFDNAKKQSILDIDRAKNINAIQKLKASIKTKIEDARDKLDKAIEQANNAFISKAKENAKSKLIIATKQEINNIQPTKILILGATIPVSDQANFKKVKEKAILNIENAQTIQSIQIAKKNGKNLVEDARDELDNAIEQANNDFISKTKDEAKQEINNIQPTKVLIQGANKTIWEQSNFVYAKKQVISTINNLKTIDEIQTTTISSIKNLINLGKALDLKIQEANNEFISKTKDEAKQEINNIQPTRLLIQGATKPKPTQTNFNNAKKQVIMNIEKEKTIESIQNTKISSIKNLINLKNKLDQAIEQANNAFISKTKVEAKQEINSIQPTKVLILGANKPEPAQTNFKKVKEQAILNIYRAKNINTIQQFKALEKTKIEDAREKLDNAIEQANNDFISKKISDLKDATKQEINNIQPTKSLIPGANMDILKKTNFDNAKNESISNIKNAQTIESIQNTKISSIINLIDLRNKLDQAIEQANNAFISKTKVEAKKQINNIQPTKVLIQGATKPEPTHANFEKAKNKAITNIENDQTIESIQNTKNSSIDSLTKLRNKLDQAIEQANNDLDSEFKKANSNIKAIQEEIRNWKGKVVKNTKNISSINDWEILNKKSLNDLAGSSITFPSDLKGTTISYKHDGLDKDHKMTVNVKIEKKPGQTRNVSFIVEVSDINNGVKFEKAASSDAKTSLEKQKSVSLKNKLNNSSSFSKKLIIFISIGATIFILSIFVLIKVYKIKKSKTKK